MTLVLTPEIGRRHLIGGLSAVSAALLLPSRLAAQAALAATPRQTAGPFYPVDWAGDSDGDLVVVTGEAARAQGTVAHVQGRVLDIRGQPVSGALVEIWQCDAVGVYRHPADERGTRRHDSGFQGRGRVVADASGTYKFRTIRPVAYPGRTPHIHIAVKVPKQEKFTTQCYVKGHPGNDRDGIFRSLRDEKARGALLVDFIPIQESRLGELAAKFDIVLGFTPEA